MMSIDYLLGKKYISFYLLTMHIIALLFTEPDKNMMLQAYDRMKFHKITSLGMGKGFSSSPKPLISKKHSDDKLRGKILETLKPNTDKLQNIVSSSHSTTIENHCESFNTSFPLMKILCNDPPIFEIENFMSHSLCDEYIERAQSSGFEIASQKYSSTASSIRTSTTWYMNYSKVPELLRQAQQLLGKSSILHFEEPQIVRYMMGQQFSWHFDAIPKSIQTSSGQRIATLIVYLNTLDIGGATVFKDFENIKVKPVKGKALLFFPSYLNGTSDDRTMHAGQIAMDTKWIAQLWMHSNPYSPVMPPTNNHEDGITAIAAL